MKPCNHIKKRLQHPSFPVSIAKNFKSTYFEEYLQTVASDDGNISFK